MSSRAAQTPPQNLTSRAGTVRPATPAADAAPATGGACTVPAIPDATSAVPAAADAGPGGPSADVPSPRAQVLITVPVMALLGVTEEPAMLDGYGPIPPSMARQLIANGADSFHRVLIDPRDGAPLEIGRTSYPVTKAMRQWLRLRDGKCPFPGCNNQSLDNEADHVLAWAKGGTTGISNLGQPCSRTTSFATPRPGHPPNPAKTNHPAGSHPPDGTTKANTPTGNHPTGQLSQPGQAGL